MAAGELLRRAVRRHRGRMLAGVLVLSLHQATEAAVPVAIGVFVDRAVSTGHVQPLLWCVLMMVVLFAVLSNAWKTGARQVVRAIEYETHLLRLEIAARVLDPRGHRTESGTHDVLLATGGRYAQLWHSWTGTATPGRPGERTTPASAST